MNVNVTNLPKTLYKSNTEIPQESMPDRFAVFFDSKIRKLLDELEICEDKYNGERKITEGIKQFMDGNQQETV